MKLIVKFLVAISLLLLLSCSDDTEATSSDNTNETTIAPQGTRGGAGDGGQGNGEQGNGEQGNGGQGTGGQGTDGNTGNDDNVTPIDNATVSELFGGRIDFNNLLNYENQNTPPYINRDNTRGNSITDGGATLGRVLFYDTKLSVSNTISCASCHQQQFAFGDPQMVSTGVDGFTGRHSMRLINARYGEETNFFWDERAESLEEQTTMPIQDHIEMGFSGENGDPSIDDLIESLGSEPYYNELFGLAFGTGDITEERMQLALAQFIRSIESFDTKYDAGRAQVNNGNQNFPNFTQQENRGKRLFQQNPNFQGNSRVGGGLGCQSCHQAPTFSIDNNSRNNGVINTASDINGRDVTITRSPTLRDLFDDQGILNGPMMHTGRFESMEDVLAHYNNINAQGNNNLDRRLRRGNGGQSLNMTEQEVQDVIAFLKTLSGSNVYINEKWSDPFGN